MLENWYEFGGIQAPSEVNSMMSLGSLQASLYSCGLERRKALLMQLQYFQISWTKATCQKLGPRSVQVEEPMPSPGSPVLVRLFDGETSGSQVFSCGAQLNPLGFAVTANVQACCMTLQIGADSVETPGCCTSLRSS